MKACNILKVFELKIKLIELSYLIFHIAWGNVHTLLCNAQVILNVAWGYTCVVN